MKTGSGPPSAILPVTERSDTPESTPLSEPVPESVPATDGPVPGQPALEPFPPRARPWILAVVGLLGFLFLLRIASILSPFLWGVVVAYAFSPLIRYICRYTRLPRFAVVSAVYLTWLGALALVLAVAVPRLNAQINQLANDLPAIVGDLQARYFGSTNQPLQVAGLTIDVPQITRQIASSLDSFVNNFAGGHVYRHRRHD